MLTLTRKIGQSISIGEHVHVVVIGTENGRVKLGVTAPREIAVLRTELMENITQENKQALVNAVLARTKSAKGTVAAPERPSIEFAAGIWGLGKHRNFVVCDTVRYENVHALVAADDSSIVLSIIAADNVPNLPACFTSAVLAATTLEDEEYVVACVVHLPRESEGAFVNLAAPILIGTQSHRGTQLLIDHKELPVRHAIPASTLRVRTE